MSVQKHISAFYTIYLEKYGLIGVKLKLLCSLLVQRFNSWTPNSWLKLTKYCQMTAWLYSHTFKIEMKVVFLPDFTSFFIRKSRLKKNREIPGLVKKITAIMEKLKISGTIMANQGALIFQGTLHCSMIALQSSNKSLTQWQSI